MLCLPCVNLTKELFKICEDCAVVVVAKVTVVRRG